MAQKKLIGYHLRTLGDVANADPALLKQVFGKNTQLMIDRCRGVDTAVVSTGEPAKSVSNEISFAISLTDRKELQARIATMAHKVGRRLRRKGIEGTTLHLKIRKEDLSVRTCQRHKANLGTNDLTWLPELYSMLNEVWDGWEPLRLVGVGVSGFESEPVQETLFDIAPITEANDHSTDSPLIRNAEANKKLLEANDLIAQRFGENAVRFGHELRTYQETTGSSAKNPEDYKD